MDRAIVISSLLQHVQVGLVENGRLVEYFLERDVQDRLLNNIYKGRVENVLPGMDAAFVDLGLPKNAFLFLADLSGEKTAQNLRKGDSLLVQVTKEAEGTKGPRVTTKITLPGRFLVLLPTQEGVGISRQISDEGERSRLKALAAELLPEGMGLIVRTMAQEAEPEELREELEALLQEWARIQRKFKSKSCGPLLYRDHDLIYRIIRDLYRPQDTRIVVDSPSLLSRVQQELKDLGLDSTGVELYQGKVGIFTHLGLDKDLERARSPRVWLDCGGYLVINQTEALLTIDVNTGKYVGGVDLQDTVLRTNLGAAEEIARQLRLRNIGGIVIIDFVHMPQEAHREQVLSRLAESLGADKTRTKICGFTRLGLVELVRRKAKRPLTEMLEMQCPHCRGSGRVDSHDTTALRIARAVQAAAAEDEVEAVLVRCHSAVAAQLIGTGGKNLELLEKEVGKAVFVRGDDTYAWGEFELSCGSADLLQKEALPVAVGQRLTVEILEPHAKNPGSGLARLEGYALECLGCSTLVGQQVEVEIVEVYRTSALARPVENRN
ncbi:MAG TPA: Rne/Rng family ribonuclease [Limnochordia bacterium]|nr:Rne/Rng family ribonuclease [Limnochordia bacterium]